MTSQIVSSRFHSIRATGHRQRRDKKTGPPFGGPAPLLPPRQKLDYVSHNVSVGSTVIARMWR